MEALRIGNVDIDIRKHSLVSTPSFVQNDSNVIRVSIYDNGEPADLSNIGKVVVNYKRPDRQIISRELTRSNNVVDYKIGLPEMEKVGVAQVELQLYDLSGSARLSLFRFSVNIVDEIGTQEVREDNDDVTLLQEIFMEVEDIRDYSLTQAEAAKKAAESAVTNWKQPVANKAAVDALPSPKLGDTVQTNDNGYVYRYDGKAWVKTQEYGATALANVNALLAETKKQQQVTPMLQSYESNAELYRTAVLHDSDNTIYAVYSRTGATYDFQKSTDWGQTWTNVSRLPAAIKCAVKISKTGTIIIVEETSTTVVSNPRMWRSTDAGVTWSLVNPGLKFSPLSAQGMTETPSGAICLGEYGNIGNHSYRVLRSIDDGVTWNVVLSSPGTHPAGDPGHFHSVTYDKYSGKLITFMDIPSTGTDGPHIYTSSDEGETWDLLGKSTTNKMPNFVSPMYFETHIAWGSDNERNGVFSRISRQEFFAGKFDKVQDVAQLNKKATYFTFPIREGVWVASMATETVAASQFPEGPGSFANEVVVISDNGAVVSGGIVHYQSTAIPGTLAGRRITFPSYKFDRLDHVGLSWMNLTTGAPRPYGAMPYSQGVGLPASKTSGWGTSIPTLPNMLPLTAKAVNGTEIPMLFANQYDQVVLNNGKASSGAELRFSENGDMEVYQNSKRVMLIRGAQSVLENLALATNGIGIKVGSGDPNGVVAATQGSIYLNWQGGIGVGLWVKQSGSSGNSGWVPANTSSGNTAARPTSTYAGMPYFDTTLNKPIWRNSANNGWVDALGATI